MSLHDVSEGSADRTEEWGVRRESSKMARQCGGSERREQAVVGEDSPERVTDTLLIPEELPDLACPVWRSVNELSDPCLAVLSRTKLVVRKPDCDERVVRFERDGQVIVVLPLLEEHSFAKPREECGPAFVEGAAALVRGCATPGIGQGFEDKRSLPSFK
jgi:hypothetical protein